MKVTELFEEFQAPERNKKLGYNPDAKIPTGGTKEWLKSFGATAEDVEEAIKLVKKSDVYKQVLALGLEDQSAGRRDGGTKAITFIGYTKDYSRWTSRVLRDARIKLTVQPNGKIDETARNNYHRAPMASGKPRIVPGKPVESIRISMENALQSIVRIMTKRRAEEKKRIAAAEKA